MQITKILKSLDYALLCVVGLILVVSFFVLESATVTASAKYGVNFVLRQIAWTVVSILVFFAVLYVDYSRFAKYGKFIYGLNLSLLLATLVLGTERSISLGPVSFQPAEIVKILLILGLAQFLVPRVGKLNTFKEMFPVFLYVFIPFLLILKQPDLGTGLVYIAIMLGMLLVAGAPPGKLLLLIVGGLGAVSLAIFGHLTWGWWLPLKPYQLNRLIVFIDPMIDPRDAGWNIIQSKIAIGSGGFWGKGWGLGSQNVNNFLPEQWTDFIFCVLAEEFGFVGALLLLCLFFYLIYRGIIIAREAKDIYGTLLAMGVITMFAFHILQNIGMTMGIMPITGIPLPFVSYGGSSLVANMAALGLLMNVYVYHEERIMF